MRKVEHARSKSYSAQSPWWNAETKNEKFKSENYPFGKRPPRDLPIKVEN